MLYLGRKGQDMSFKTICLVRMYNFKKAPCFFRKFPKFQEQMFSCKIFHANKFCIQDVFGINQSINHSMKSL